MATPIITDGSTDRVRHAPRVVLPTRAAIFSERANRLESLATTHPMADFLRFMAAVAHAQQAALSARRAPSPTEAAIAASRDYGMPPLSAQAHERAALWRNDLAEIAQLLRAKATGDAAAALERLLALEGGALEGLADRVLAGTTLDDDAAYVPLVGAALQVYFARLAATLPTDAVDHCDVPGICPVCASRPLASVVHLGGDQANLRYLVCSLCATEWNLSRIQCSSCQSEKSVHYLALTREGDKPTEASARAEACEECKSYLKIFYQDKDAFAEPNADDLATLGLDVMVGDEGYARSGPNLLFHPGSG